MERMFTEEHIALRDSVRKFSDREIKPIAMEYDKKDAFPLELIPKMAELDYFGIMFPEKYGGLESDFLSEIILVEELSRGDAGVSATAYVHFLCCNPIFLFGTEAQKEKYLSSGIKGSTIGAIAITEPNHGSNVNGVETTAILDGNDYILNGTKMFITNATFADWVIVVAKTEKSSDHKGITLFLVEKGTPGFSISRKLDKLGWRTSETAELVFDNCRVPKENILGEVGTGFYHIMEDFNYERLLIAAQSVGIAQAALEASLAYVTERKQFGRPISDFQGLRHKIADMATEIEAARRLVYATALNLEVRGTAIAKESSMAKLFASEMVNKVTGDAIQIHGGYGFMMEYEVQKYYRDARVLTIGGGTSEIQKNVIAKRLGI